jgi:hypothetical protein
MRVSHLWHPTLFIRCTVSLTLLLVPHLRAADPLPLVTGVDWQPLAAQAQRLIEAAAYLGSPLDPADIKAIGSANVGADAETAVARVQQILDRHCLFGVTINPEMRVKVTAGPAKPELVENGWRMFLVKVQNESGTTAALRAASPNGQRLHNAQAGRIQNLWLDLQMFDSQPLARTLSGLKLEYRIIQLYSRDAGKREAKFSFDVGQGTQDIGFRNEVDALFTCLPAGEITLRVRDEHDKPTTASFQIRDAQGRVYPSQAKRLAPDFAFHPQVYRGDGEKLHLPAGAYTIEFARGPESVAKIRKVTVTKDTRSLDFKVERWIDPSTLGWWSGDHHIHAAGCAHYVNPTEGVHAPDMIRHCLGEDLKIGANLTWGPCFDYQKQFFTGKDDKVSQYPYLLRYDVEVSGFGSHRSGHLCLLRLREQMYPGGDSWHHWPTLCLNTLRWAKKQGALVGPAHSGWGLEVKTSDLPTFELPPFNGIGANEYIVDVTHEVPGPDGKLVPAVDFISTVDTPYVWELNIWYHTLNAGFRTRISGETDFPCIYGERVGLGRSYVKLDGPLIYEDWCEGIRQGRNYVSDGRSHLIGMVATSADKKSVSMGENGSELRLKAAGKVRVSARVAARLNEQPNPELQKRPYSAKPYWDIERARIDASREVPVEVLVNGFPAGRKTLLADGRLQEMAFDVPIERSSWVALRILPSSHTNPIFILVDDKPIRASRKSIEWCLKSVDNCWNEKKKVIQASEMNDAIQAYEHARQTYKRLLAEAGTE